MERWRLNGICSRDGYSYSIFVICAGTSCDCEINPVVIQTLLPNNVWVKKKMQFPPRSHNLPPLHITGVTRSNMLVDEIQNIEGHQKDWSLGEIPRLNCCIKNRISIQGDKRDQRLDSPGRHKHVESAISQGASPSPFSWDPGLNLVGGLTTGCPTSGFSIAEIQL